MAVALPGTYASWLDMATATEVVEDVLKDAIEGGRWLNVSENTTQLIDKLIRHHTRRQMLFHALVILTCPTNPIFD